MKHQGRRKFVKDLSLFSITTSILPLHSCVAFSNSIRFGLATDTHYAQRTPVGTRFYKGALAKMQDFINVMNAAKVDFVMHLGDLKDESKQGKSEETLGFLRQVEKVYAGFSGPRYHCVGNHDVDSIRKEQFLVNIENTGISNKESYYSFNSKGFHFIVLDANYDQNGANHYFKEGADWQDTNITPEQMGWLQQDLAQNEYPVLVFCHHPLFEYFRDGHKYHVNNYQAVQEVLEKDQKTIAVFQGHVHEERFKKINGIHYITQLGMVDYEGISNNSFAVVEIGKDKIILEGYKRSSSVEKEF